jgi:Second Messenger Oligonucleotide or Dinucleotide Synthetase domain
MPRTVTQGFALLRSNLEITGLQAASVSTTQNNVRAVMKEGTTVLDDFLVGSYMRNTMIAPLVQADIDVFVVLDPKYYEAGGQASLLDKVKRVLQKQYPTTPHVSRNGQAVTIRLTTFTIDIVPGFHRSGGGFLIPDSNSGSWIETNPKTHIDMWSKANADHKGDLVPLIKMIKCWNREHSCLLNSFHLECLVLQILAGVRIDSFSFGARYVFEKMKDKINYKNLDPAGFGGDVGAYLNTQSKREAVIDRLEKAYQRAVSAEELERLGKTDDAFMKWRLNFGDYFPAYG